MQVATETKRRSIWGWTWRGYLAIGAMFGSIQWLSYAWAVTWGWQGGVAAQMIAIPLGLGAGTLAGIIRLFLWGPSLLLLIFTPHDHWTFIRWLATGLDTGAIAK